MALNFQAPNYSFSLPWFIYDIFNNQLITTNTVPGDISDQKAINLTETQVPGMNFAPITSGGNGNRKIKFSIPLLKRNNTIGNSLLLNQLKALRNQATGILTLTGRQFSPNPKVLFYWGTGSVPLIYFLKEVSFSHRANWSNQQGQPQLTDCSIELWMDETDPLYQAEKMFRDITIITNQGYDAINNVFNPGTGRAY